jgi:hypothetical protein
MRAHSLGAVNISVLSIANTLSRLKGIPFFISNSVVSVGFEIAYTSVAVHGTNGKVIDVLTSSMTRAVIGARSS